MNARTPSTPITEQAARWHAAQHADDMDWDGFTAWLEADQRHRHAMDALTIIDDAISERRAAIAALLPGPSDAASRPIREGESEGEGRSRSRGKIWGWGLAASGAIAAALTIMVGLPRQMPDRRWTSTTAALSVTLPDGIRAILAPHSRLTAERGDATRLALVGGAYFDVEHRTARPLAITAGDLVVRDVGTRFDIVTGAAGTRVAVAQGQVTVASPRLSRAVALTAGRTLAAADGAVTLGRAAPDDVASWRRGQLVYDGTPLALVAAEIGRYARRPVFVDPRIADRSFSGVLNIGDGARLGKDVAAIADVGIRDDDAGLHLEPRRR